MSGPCCGCAARRSRRRLPKAAIGATRTWKWDWPPRRATRTRGASTSRTTRSIRIPARSGCAASSPTRRHKAAASCCLRGCSPAFVCLWVCLTALCSSPIAPWAPTRARSSSTSSRTATLPKRGIRNRSSSAATCKSAGCTGACVRSRGRSTTECCPPTRRSPRTKRSSSAGYSAFARGRPCKRRMSRCRPRARRPTHRLPLRRPRNAQPAAACETRGPETLTLSGPPSPP